MLSKQQAMASSLEGFVAFNKEQARDIESLGRVAPRQLFGTRKAYGDGIEDSWHRGADPWTRGGEGTAAK